MDKSRLNQFIRSFNVERIQAVVTGIEDGYSRTNQKYWKIFLDSGDTLYTYQFSTIANVEVGKVNILELERKGRWFHVTSGYPAGGAPSTGVGSDTQPKGELITEPIGDNGYPASWDGESGQKTAIETPKRPQPGFTKTGGSGASGGSYGGKKVFSGGKNNSFAMSYAKDIGVAFINNDKPVTLEEIFTMAESIFNWLENH